MTNANKKNAQPKYFKPVFAALLAALIVLLTFTIGGLRIGPLTITFNCLPLAVGAIFLGPVYGAILGLVFGLCSFIASFTTGSLTTILLNVNPFLTFLMCVVPRVICGFVPGLIFKHLPKDSEPKRLGASALCCALVPIAGNVFLFIYSFAGINAVMEIILNLVLGTAICRALLAVTKNKI